MSRGALENRKSWTARFLLLVLLWLIVAGWSLKDLPIGLAAAAGATRISLKLSPPAHSSFRPAQLLPIVFNVLRGSLAAGFDVARRALSPRLDLSPGFVTCPLSLPPGGARESFCLLQSLEPGTLPTGAEGAILYVHGLDLGQPIAATFAAEEARFRKALGA